MDYHRKNKMGISGQLWRVSLLGLLSIFFLFGLANSALAATQWVSDPATCNMLDPTNFPGQNCDPDRICGDSSGIAQCYNTASLLPPAISATSNTLYSASYPNGGYILNCYAAKDGAAPFCDNSGAYWCNRSNTCYTTQQRDTTCTANTWATATCGACRSGFADCNGDLGVCEVQYNVTDYTSGTNNHYGVSCLVGDVRCDSGYYDCDATGVAVGNGCEALRSGSCTTGGGLTGTWSCSVDAGGSCTDGGSNYTCTCVPPKQYFETGTEAQYATTDPLLWGVQFGAGDLIHFGNGSNSDLFVVQNDGSVNLAQISAPAITTDLLYNVGGNLYWNGAMVGAGGGGSGTAIWDADSDTGIQTEETADEDIIRMDVAGSEVVVVQDTMNEPVLKVNSTLGGYVNLMFNNNDEYDRFDVRTVDVLNQFGGGGGLNFNSNPEEGFNVFYDNNISGMGLNTQYFHVGVNNHTNALKIDGNANVGLGLETPHAKLDIGDGMIATPSGDMSVLLTQDGGETFFETSSTDMAEGLIMHGPNIGQAYDYGIVRSIASPPGSYGDNMERGLHIFTGDNDGPDPDNIMFWIEGNEIMRITDQGRVAIGTNSPIGARLQVNSNSIINTYFEINDNSRGGLYVGNGGMFSVDEAGLYDAGGDYPLAVFDAANNRMRYGNSLAINVDTGNVGVRTANPNFPLHVDSTTGINTYFQMDDNSRGGVYIGNGGMYSGDEAGLYDVGGDFPLAVYDASNDTVKLGHEITVDVNTGFIGMAESSPVAQLEITDRTSTTFEPLLMLSHGGAGQSVGLVPVGANPDGVVTSPRGSLAMDYNNGMLYINRDGATDWQSLMVGSSIWDGDTDTGIEVEESLDEDYLRFYTAGTDRMRITNQGNVQMGAGGHLAATLSVNGMPGQAIAGFRDADGEDIFSAIGRLSTNNFEFIIGDTTGIYPNSYGGSTGILLNQASESITFGRSQIRFQEGGGGDYVGFLAPASVTTPVIWTLPATDGTNGQALTTNGAGVLSWSSAGGAQTLQDVADYTISQDGYVTATFGSSYFEDDGGAAKWEANAGGYQMAMGIPGATYLNFISDNGVNNSGQVEFMDSRPLGDRRGIEYVADYSADFTDRSLVDKAYVDGLANSGWTDDGTVVRLTTITDNVGIGTATPAVKLDVNAGAYGEIARFYNGDSRFVFGADLYGGEAGLYDANTGELIAGQVMGNPNLVMLGQYAMYINQTSKNVGVGTSTPDRLFHVENLDAVTNAITYGQRVTHASSGVVAAGFGTGLEFELENASNTNRIAGSIANIWGNATNAAEDGEMVFRTMLNGTLAERMRIDDYGNVAIGSSDAGGYKLYVQGRTMVDAGGDATAFVVYNGPNDNYQIRVDGDANNVLLSESNGYVGIGLSNPTQLLHMTSPATAASMLLTDESGQIGIQLGYDAGGGSYLEGDYFGNDRSFTIKSNSGYKWATFGVDGTAGFGQSADDLNYAINVTDAGNVGVGTSLPDRRFQVEVDNTSHNVVTYGGRLVHTISGIGPAPTTGFGTGLEFELENGSGINRVAGTIENLWASSLNTFENSDMAFKTMQEGVLTTGLYIGDAGNVVIGGTGATDRLVINNTPATSQSFFRINGEGGAMKMGFDGIYGIFDYDYTDTGTDLSFQSNGNEVMILNDDGSVQIGLGQDPVGPMLTLMGDTSVADAPILQFRTLDPDIQSEIYFSDTGNSTYWNINSSGAGGGLILMNGTEEMAKFAGNGLVFNEGGLGTLDFRIEGDTNVNGLYFDSSGDGMLGLGTTPNSVLDVYFSDTTTALSLLDFSSFGGVNQSLMPDGAGIIWDINRSNNNGSLVFENYGTALLSINSNVSLPGVTVATTSRTTAAFDRKTTDGVIISLQQDSVQEGTISVSGNTISFNPFTGSHYAWHEGNIERATVVSLTGKNKHLNDNENSEVLYGVEITKQINSPKVLGSYLDILESQEELSTTNPALVMAVGNGEAWVADKGENIEAGDYLISSDVAGHAQKMDADFALNYVFARAAEDIDWSEVNETVDGVKHKVITVFFDSLVVNTQTVDVIKDNQSLGSKLNLAKMTVSEANKVKKQLGGEMKVGSDNSVGGMQVGQATIPSKRSAVDVTFSEKYESAPIVMLTLASDSSLMRYFVSDVTASGFRLNLYPTQYSDTLFNWQAYPASNVQSGASAEPLDLEDLPEYQVEEPVIEEEIVIPPADEVEETEVEVNETGLEILSESADAASEAGTEEANTLQLEDAEDVLYNDALSIVEAGDELSEQIEEETPAVEEVPVVEETPVTEETPAVEETPAP